MYSSSLTSIKCTLFNVTGKPANVEVKHLPPFRDEKEKNPIFRIASPNSCSSPYSDTFVRATHNSPLVRSE